MFNFFSLDREHYTALAFKPTVPTDQNENQQQPSISLLINGGHGVKRMDILINHMVLL
jgi:hypothetical protein